MVLVSLLPDGGDMAQDLEELVVGTMHCPSSSFAPRKFIVMLEVTTKGERGLAEGSEAQKQSGPKAVLHKPWLKSQADSGW